jgi:hypothetical protein
VARARITLASVLSRPARSSGDPLERTFRPIGPFDLFLTLAPLRHGPADPTIRFAGEAAWCAIRTEHGTACLRLQHSGAEIIASAWGAGAAWAMERVPALLGEGDDPGALHPASVLLRELSRRFSGARMTRSGSVFAALLPAIVEQKVVGLDAHRSYRRLVRKFGERAPGPVDLWLPPLPERLARLPYYVLHPLGIERRRADVIRDASSVADRLEEALAMDAVSAQRRLRLVPGIGAWTAAETVRVALGDPDVVSVGDYHLPSLVSWAFAGEPRATDARMLELLEPYRGQRARVVRLLELGGPRPPAFGPRMARRSIAAI